MPLSVEVADVTFAVGGRVLVAAACFSLPPGERLAIVGPNGAGKTTLLRLLTGRLRPDAGTVRIDGREVTEIPAAERARLVAVVGQGETPDHRLTVADYVELGRIPHRGQASPSRHRAVVEAALDRVGIVGLARRPLGTLSGGEKQRAAIARALAQEPGLLVLDEPTNHLDPRARADVLRLARSLGITVVAVLHELPLVGPFADLVAVLHRGRIVATGSPPAALRPAVVRAVFAMDSFTVESPTSGRPLLVFDASSP